MTVVLVARTGGHLVELHKLAPRLPWTGDRLWVTHRSPQSESLLADEDVEYVPLIGERDVWGVLRSLTHARDLVRERQPTAFVSTGSAIAVGYLGWAGIRGIPSHYIDTAARPDAPSRTGRILARSVGVSVYTQFPDRVGGVWSYAGSVFDEYVARQATGAPRVRRVFVTVGSTDRPFEALLRKVADIVPSDVEVRWQVGATNASGLRGPSWDFLSASKLRAEVEQADVIVSHAGCGSALTALDAGQAPVLVPRSVLRHEAGDDHQPELAHVLSELGLAVHRTVDDLAWPDLVEASRRRIGRVEPPPLTLGAG